MCSFISPLCLPKPSGAFSSCNRTCTSPCAPPLYTPRRPRPSYHACLDVEQAAIYRQQSPPGTTRHTFLWRGYETSYVIGHPEGADVHSHSPTAVLLHGFGGSARHWRRVVPALIAGGARVIAPDLLGFGASLKPPADYSVALWGEQVDALLAELGVERCVLIGNSIGSLLAIQATANIPRMQRIVDAIACCNTAGGLTSFRKEQLNFLQYALLTLFNKLLFNDLVGGWLFRRVRQPQTLRGILQNIYVNKDAVDDELLHLIAAPAYDVGALQVFLAIFNADAGPRPEPALQALLCPVLFIWGEDDVLTPLRTGFLPGTELVKLGENFRLVPVPDCGHCPMDDRPDVVNPLLTEFVLEHSSPVTAKLRDVVD